MRYRRFAIFLSLFTLICTAGFSQGDGARSHLLAPKGVWGVNAKALFMDQNLIPAGNVLVKDATIDVSVFPTTFFHTFGIGDRFAQALVMVNPGSATARFVSDTILPSEEFNANGLSDGFVGLKVGIIGAPALALQGFVSKPAGYSLFGYFRMWYSGSYDSDKLFNLGTNRFAFELGAPMAIPIPWKTTWLEVFPSVQFYTANNDPVRSARAEKTRQRPLFLIENHFTHNFTPKLWAGVDLRFQFGGRTIVDGVKDDNAQTIVGGGLLVGYQPFAFLNLYANYGGILIGGNDEQSQMFRISATFSYAK